MVELTTAGTEVIDEAFGEVLSCQRELIRSLSGEEFSAAAQILKKILLGHEGPAPLP